MGHFLRLLRFYRSKIQNFKRITLSDIIIHFNVYKSQVTVHQCQKIRSYWDFKKWNSVGHSHKNNIFSVEFFFIVFNDGKKFWDLYPLYSTSFYCCRRFMLNQTQKQKVYIFCGAYTRNLVFVVDSCSTALLIYCIKLVTVVMPSCISILCTAL